MRWSRDRVSSKGYSSEGGCCPVSSVRRRPRRLSAGVQANAAAPVERLQRKRTTAGARRREGESQTTSRASMRKQPVRDWLQVGRCSGFQTRSARSVVNLRGWPERIAHCTETPGPKTARVTGVDAFQRPSFWIVKSWKTRGETGVVLSTEHAVDLRSGKNPLVLRGL